MESPIPHERHFQLALRDRIFRQVLIEDLRRATKKNSRFFSWETVAFFCLFIAILFSRSLGREFHDDVIWLMPFLILAWLVQRMIRQIEGRLIETELRLLLAVDSILETKAEQHTETHTANATH